MKRRETLSSLDVFGLARELESSLKGAYVDKVHQLAPDDVVLKVNARGGMGKASLMLLGGRRVHLTQKAVEVPERPSTFAMAARARLANAVIEGVEQVRFDRILTIKLRKGDQHFEIVAELLPDGAVALVEGGTIAVVAKPKVFKDRKLAPKQPYVPPRPGPDPRLLGAEGLAKAAGGAEGDVARALATKAGLGPGPAAEVLARAGVDPQLAASKVSGVQWHEIAAGVEELLAEVERSPAPVALLEGGVPVDFAPVAQKRWGSGETRSYPTIGALFDDYFGSPTATMGAKPAAPAERSAHDQEFARLERVLEQQRAVVTELESEIASAQGAAEAVYANYPQVEMFLRLAKPGGSARQLSDLVRRAGLEGTAPEAASSGKSILVDLKTPDGTAHRVEVEIGANVNEIAQSYYRVSSRAKERLKGALAALGETEASLEAARRKVARSERVERARAAELAKVSGPLVPPPPKKREWFEKFRWLTSSEGNLIVAGRDAGTNDTVVKKYLKPHDRYAHADIHGAPSVVIKRSEGEAEVGEKTLDEACAFAAIMSRAWASGAGEASSYWVLPEQVSKTPESGEALGRGAFVIRGKRNTIRHVRLRAAIGGITVKGERKAMCGPESAVAGHCDVVFLIAPGTRKGTDVAKELAAKIRVHPDDIARALPPGGIEVLGPMDTRKRASSEEE